MCVKISEKELEILNDELEQNKNCVGQTIVIGLPFIKKELISVWSI